MSKKLAQERTLLYPQRNIMEHLITYKKCNLEEAEAYVNSRSFMYALHKIDKPRKLNSEKLYESIRKEISELNRKKKTKSKKTNNTSQAEIIINNLSKDFY